MAINQEEMLSVLLASTARWQSQTGAANRDEALLRLKGLQAADDDNADDGDERVAYPRAVIEHVEQETAAAGTGTWRGRGALLLSVEAQPPDDQCGSIDTQRTWFLDFIQTLDAQMRVISGSRATPTGYTTSHFQIKTISWSVEPFLMPETEQEEVPTETDTIPENVWACQLRVEY